MKRIVLAFLLLGLWALPALAADPITVSVASNPLWTSTGIVLSAGQPIRIVAQGDDIWTWGGGAEHGIDGYQPWNKPNTYDRFLYVANHGEMIGYVGSDPYQGNWGRYYYDWYWEGFYLNGRNQLPGYLHVGEYAITPEGFQWTADRSGLLWLGFNDDAKSKAIGDNIGFVEVQIYVGSPPVAEAGPNQQVHWNATVQLDGTASFDPDGDPLTFAWEMVSRPEGSSAALDDVHSPTPSFTADTLGTYTVKLVVADPYHDSAPDYVVIDTSDTAPTADAGPDQVVPAAEGYAVVTLDGSASYDPDGDPLVSYVWTWEGGSASGECPEVTLPVGSTVITLVVSDGLLDSPPDTVTIQVNRPPVAEAGPQIEAQADPTRTALVTLDGSASTDPDGDPLTYTWTWDGGSATGVNPTVELPQGWTNLTLVVNDGYADSQPDHVAVFVKGLTITVKSPQEGTIQEAIDAAQDWDTVVIGPGTYQGCITLRGKQITLMSSDGANRTIIQGDQSIFGCPLVTFDQQETPATVLDGFTLQGQVAYKGTAIYIHDSSPTIRNCVIRECVADDRDDMYPDGVGGAIWVYGTLGRPWIHNCLIYNCLATSQYGCGGIYVCCGAEATITNCTVANNWSNLGPAGLHVKEDSVVLLKDSIFWDNSPQGIQAAPEAQLDVTYTDTGLTLWPGLGNFAADPSFAGGALGGFYLGEGSPAFDAGSGASCESSLSGRTTRVDGEPDGGACDLGYHYPRTPVFIQATHPSTAAGLLKPDFGPGETVFIRVDYTIQGKPADLYKAIITVKIGPKKFIKRIVQGPGDYTSVVRCKAYSVAKPVNKKVTATIKLKAAATGALVAKDRLLTTVSLHP